MKSLFAVLLIFLVSHAFAQSCSIAGRVFSEVSKPLAAVTVSAQQRDSAAHTAITGKDGAFSLAPLSPGFYYVTIHHPGYEDFIDSIDLSTKPSGSFDRIILFQSIHMLDEFKVVEKVLAMVQKGDTMEFNSAAYKVNPDADAADLIRKMPAIQVDGQTISAQGENVVKILVDGKPFFGTDPWAALKNLPADIIGKVQVYNEKSDQEQFTGFSEGATSKTINIVTLPGKRHGVFGKVYAGGGGDPNALNADPGISDLRYGSGLTLNKFAGDRRITLTAQANNVNTQNFTDNTTGTGTGAGTATTRAAGINFSDKWGSKTEVSGSYFYNQNINAVYNQLRKTYVYAADSGQIYNESSPTDSRSEAHRFSIRFNYKIDSMNSILLSPSVNFTMGRNSSMRTGATTQGLNPVNFTNSASNSHNTAFNFTNNVLFRHKFAHKGRTLSFSLNSNVSDNDGNTGHIDTNRYYTGVVPGDTLNQQSVQSAASQSHAANVTFTEPVGSEGQLKAEYNFTAAPARSGKNTFDFDPATGTWSLPDSQYSNTYSSSNYVHKAGISYLHHFTKDLEASLGINYQLSDISNEQSQPLHFNLSHRFENILPVATLHYKLPNKGNLRASYHSGTSTPSLNQLQHAINNNDPLHLYTGNPGLLQPYRHTVTLHYSVSGRNAQHPFSVMLTGSASMHNIASNSIIATSDSLLPGNVLLHAGSQLTYPMNVEGYRSLTSFVSYGLPLGILRSKLNININAAINHTPSLINSHINYQDFKTTSIALAINSTYSEYVDFSLSSTTGITASANSINSQLTTTYVSEHVQASLNLQSHSGFIFNSTVSYQVNKGLALGYDQNYVLCNLAIGKKILHRHRGDIRLTLFDIFNQNNNIQHTVTDVYVQDSRSNMLQRYFLLTFTYKLSEFNGIGGADKKE